MKTFKSFEKYLNSLGYFISDGLCYEVVNGILYFVTFDNKEYGTTLKLRTIPNAAYRKELDKLSDGDEVEINPYDYDVNGARFNMIFKMKMGMIWMMEDHIFL